MPLPALGLLCLLELTRVLEREKGWREWGSGLAFLPVLSCSVVGLGGCCAPPPKRTSRMILSLRPVESRVWVTDVRRGKGKN